MCTQCNPSRERMKQDTSKHLLRTLSMKTGDTQCSFREAPLMCVHVRVLCLLCMDITWFQECEFLNVHQCMEL